MTNTPIDRESVERLADRLSKPQSAIRPTVSDSRAGAAALLALRAALDAAEAANALIVSAYRVNMMRHMSNYSHAAFDQHIAALEKKAMAPAEYPAWICSDCGDAHGRRPAGICTFHIGECDICGRAEMVTEPRDYGHLKDTWRKARVGSGSASAK